MAKKTIAQLELRLSEEQRLILKRWRFLKKYIANGYGHRKASNMPYVIARIIEGGDNGEIQVKFLSKGSIKRFKGTSTDTALFNKLRAIKFLSENKWYDDMNVIILSTAVHYELSELQSKMNYKLLEIKDDK